VWKLDRMSRSMLDLLRRMKDLEDRGINFRSLTEGIDTNTPAGKLLLHVIGALAQFERDLIVERTKAGIAEFKARGGRIGQPRKLSDEDMAEVMQMVREGISVRKIAARFNVVPGTIYNYLEGTISALRAEGVKAPKRKRKPSK
jgi:DNA invertase Pin-like site-specific DNA recombinase